MAAMNDPNLFPFSYGFEFSSKWLESEGYFLTVVANIYIVSIRLFSFSARALWDWFDWLKQGWACKVFRKLRVKMQENEVMMEQ